MTRLAPGVHARAEAAGWQVIADGVLVRNHAGLDVNCGLVLGEERALVIDTRASTAQGLELLAAVRQVTELELVVVNTHGHFDHTFGNAAFRDFAIYAHPDCAAELVDRGEAMRAEVIEFLRAADREESVPELEGTEILLPFYLVEDETPLELGERTVHLVPTLDGHVTGMLAVIVPDAGVTFWSDLVEVGADPEYDDSFPLTWPQALESLLAHPLAGAGQIAVPGHGAVVDRDEVVRQAQLQRQLAELLRGGIHEGVTDPEVLAALAAGTGLGEEALLSAARRALATAGPATV